jgi:hypothetical protein
MDWLWNIKKYSFIHCTVIPKSCWNLHLEGKIMSQSGHKEWWPIFSNSAENVCHNHI